MTLYATIRALSRSDEAPVGHKLSRPLTAEDVAAVRYPGEIAAAKALRRVPGFREELRRMEHDDRVAPTRLNNLQFDVRLEREVAPTLFAAVDEAMRVMGVRAPCEVFQIQGETNASVLSKPDRVVLSIEGPFFDIFTEDEMRGVFAHEFAHHLAHGAASPEFYDVNRVASGWRDAEDTGEDRRKRVASSAWSIAKEITADRFEVLVGGGLMTYLRASMKFTAELGSAPVLLSPETYLRQVREAIREGTGAVDRRSTHPDRHLRVRAAELFTETDVFRRLTGEAGGRPIADVNREIASLLAGWTGNGARTIDQHRFERFLLGAATAIAAADGSFRLEERRFLEAALPDGWQGRLPGADEAGEIMDAFAREVVASNDDRARVTALNFLCGLIEADGRVHDAEVLALLAVGKALGAADMFKREVEFRYEWEPSPRRQKAHDETDDAVRDMTPSLKRYLDTVVLKGSRKVTLKKLLALGRYGRRSEAALKRLAAVLDASGIKAPKELARYKSDDEITLKAE